MVSFSFALCAILTSPSQLWNVHSCENRRWNGQRKATTKRRKGFGKFPKFDQFSQFLPAGFKWSSSVVVWSQCDNQLHSKKKKKYYKMPCPAGVVRVESLVSMVLKHLRRLMSVLAVSTVAGQLGLERAVVGLDQHFSLSPGCKRSPMIYLYQPMWFKAVISSFTNDVHDDWINLLTYLLKTWALDMQYLLLHHNIFAIQNEDVAKHCYITGRVQVAMVKMVARRLVEQPKRKREKLLLKEIIQFCK